MRDHALEVQRQVHEQLGSAVIREEVNDAIHCLVGVVRMQGAKAQMASFREVDCVLHRLAGAHFADHDHVRRLAQRVLQRVLPAIGVDADFALGDDAALVAVHVLDRVFDGDDVAA